MNLFQRKSVIDQVEQEEDEEDQQFSRKPFDGTDFHVSLNLLFSYSEIAQ